MRTECIPSCMHYEVTGNGEAVVFLHSLACDRAMFVHQVEALSRRYRVINVDLPGHAGSPGRAERPWTLEQIADDLVALLDNLSIASAHWVGLSMGAMLALRIALRAPERVRRLILMNASANEEDPSKHRLYLSLAERIGGGELRSLRQTLINIYFAPTTQSLHPEITSRWFERLAAMDPAGLYEAALAVFNRSDLSAELGRVKAPTLVVTGEFDQARTYAESQAMAQGIPGARLAVIPDAAHLSTLEQPEKASALIATFLEE